MTRDKRKVKLDDYDDDFTLVLWLAGIFCTVIIGGGLAAFLVWPLLKAAT